MKLTAGHPSEETLLQVVLQETTADPALTPAHLADCISCRQRVRRLQLLHRHLTAAPREAPRRDALRSIMQRRASGQRVALADERVRDTTRSYRSRRVAIRWALGVAAAAGIAVAVKIGVRRSELRDAAAEATRLSEVMVGRTYVPRRPETASWWSLGYTSDAPEVGEPVYGAAMFARIENIRDGALQYVRSGETVTSAFQPTGVLNITVSSTQFDRRRAWRVTATHPVGGTWSSHDTTWLRASDLKLLQRRMTMMDSRGNVAQRVVQRARGDTALLQTDSTFLWTHDAQRPPVGNASMTTIVLNPRYITLTDPTSFILALRALPLHRTWRGTVDINARRQSVAFDGPPRHVNLRVSGDSVINSFWSDVSCWRVLLENGTEPERWYVSKESGQVMLVLRPLSADASSSRLHLISRTEPVLLPTRSIAP